MYDTLKAQLKISTRTQALGSMTQVYINSGISKDEWTRVIVQLNSADDFQVSGAHLQYHCLLYLTGTYELAC